MNMTLPYKQHLFKGPAGGKLPGHLNHNILGGVQRYFSAENKPFIDKFLLYKKLTPCQTPAHRLSWVPVSLEKPK